jgi:hypothetical protein
MPPVLDRIFRRGQLVEISPDFYRYEIGGADYYAAAGGTFSSSNYLLSKRVETPFYLVGAQIAVQLPSFTQYASLTAYLVKATVGSAASIATDSGSIETSDIMLMASAAMARNTNGEFAGSRVGSHSFSTGDSFGIPFGAGTTIHLHFDYRGAIAQGNVPTPNTSGAVVRLILHRVPYVA